MPMKSLRVAPVSPIASRNTPSTSPTIRSATASSPAAELVGIDRIARCFVPSSDIAPATMFVPPRSTPMMYCCRAVVMRVRLV
jgi:hypothetical protein